MPGLKITTQCLFLLIGKLPCTQCDLLPLFAGDRAIRDSDGYFYFVGRSDDVILSAGLVVNVLFYC